MLATKMTDHGSNNDIVQASEVTPAHKSTLKALCTQLLISLFGVVLALGIAEVAFRLIAPTTDKAIITDTPKVDYLPESAFRTRDVYHPPTKAPGAFRIIVIGDSFTFGGKVHWDDNFSKRLERLLNLNENQRKVEVLNWGVSGYSSVQEVELLKTAVSDFQPDLIVMQITLNDAELQPYRVTHKYQNEQGKIILQNPLFTYWKSLGYLVSRVLNTMTHKEYIRYHSAAFEDPDSWGHFEGAWSQVSQISTKHSVPLLAVIFPMLSHPFDEKYPFHAVHEKIRNMLDSKGISRVDLFDDFRGRDPNRMQVEPGQDAHPNEIAHRIAADRIYATLVERKFIPPDVIVKKVRFKGLVKPMAVRPPEQPTPPTKTPRTKAQ
jgi:lysophospholipase L1-like esterase